MNLVFDLECDGLIDSNNAHILNDRYTRATKVHCMVVRDVDSGQEWRFANDPQFGLPSVKEGLALLEDAGTLVGHNIIRYDLQILKMFYDWTPSDSTVIRDTLVMSHMGYTSLYDKDVRVAWKNPDFPRSLTGQHSLRSWGHRMGIHKGHVNDSEDFSVCDQEMIDYCARDVEVNAHLYKRFMNSWAAAIPDAVQVEHEFYLALEEMMHAGWWIDTDRAGELLEVLESERIRLESEILDVFPARVVPAYNPDHKDPSKRGEQEPTNPFWNPKQLKSKPKTYPFKPGSDIQKAYWLNKLYGWTPHKDGWTKTGKAKMTEDILSALPWPEAQQLVAHATVVKRISSLVGDTGYLTLLNEKTGRLHGKIDHCGAVTHRCTHSNPNLGNPTSLKKKYGREIRSIFAAPPGYRIVGADASGPELRGLANRMAKYDGGSFAREVLEGDPHTANKNLAGLEDDPVSGVSGRDKAKTLIYGINYGAGNKKVGMIAKPSGEYWSEKELVKAGKNLKAKLFDGRPALKDLIADLKKGFRPGQAIIGLDGRVAENRAAHQSLNTQLQMDGAVVMKWATVLLRRKVKERGWEWGPDKDWCLVGHIHDEVQMQVREELADEAGKIAVESIREAGDLLSVACRLDAEYAVGASWADTH